MFEDFELNPAALLLAVIGAVVTIWGTREVGLFWRIATFIGTLIAIYFAMDYWSNK